MLERKKRIQPLIMSLCLLALLAGLTGCRGVLSFDDLTLTSSNFQKLTELPAAHIRDSGNQSPALDWSNAKIPHGTRSFVVIMDDLDANGKIFNHWVMYNIPVNLLQLEQGMPKTAELPNGAEQGKNDFGEIGYDGPQNRDGDHPAGTSHRFNFKLYALNKTLTFEGDVTKQAVVDAMLESNAIIGEGHLMATYAGVDPDAGLEP